MRVLPLPRCAPLSRRAACSGFDSCIAALALRCAASPMHRLPALVSN